MGIGLTKDKVLLGWGHPEYVNSSSYQAQPNNNNNAVTNPVLINNTHPRNSDNEISNLLKISHFTLSGRSLIYKDEENGVCYGLGDSQTGQFFIETEEIVKNKTLNLELQDIHEF